MTRLRPPPWLSSKFVALELHYLWMTGYFRHRCVNHANQASIASRALAETVPLVVASTREGPELARMQHDPTAYLVQAMRSLEESCFGATLSSFGRELKGHRLLDKDRFKFAAQGPEMDDLARRKHALAFLQKGANKGTDARRPFRDEFTAYGQACLKMARGIFELLRGHEARVVAVAIPRNVAKPPEVRLDEILRKDHVFLLERFFYLLQAKNNSGLLVLDESDKTEDRRLVQRIERYFTKTATGRHRAHHVVPSPFFVSSDMTYPVQAADVCIYCINWGYRMQRRGMDAPVREEIASEFGPLIETLEFHGKSRRDGRDIDVYGITYVPDRTATKTLMRRPQTKKGGNAFGAAEAPPWPSLHGRK